ncbi:MAG: hypothetical protein AAGG55_10995 [Pseudomonadota bacterium]
MTVSAETVVVQSQRSDRLQGWQGRCCASVKRWAEGNGFGYELLGDELFDLVPDALREKFAGQPVVLSDLARLFLLRRALSGGASTAIWCDADLLVFRDFQPRPSRESFGRECWLQLHDGKQKRYRKIHNAWLQFSAESPVLGFYLDRALTLLETAEVPVVPQFVGPKLLTAWHNMVPFPVEERVGMLSPLAAKALLDDERKALSSLMEGHDDMLCALNLSASCEGREVDEITLDESAYAALIDGLQSGELVRRIVP